jgi:hypothetical protein
MKLVSIKDMLHNYGCRIELAFFMTFGAHGIGLAFVFQVWLGMVLGNSTGKNTARNQ